MQEVLLLSSKITDCKPAQPSMSLKGNRALLVKSLARAVGWEEAMMQGVADAICAAGTREEVQELTRVNQAGVAYRLAIPRQMPWPSR